ncbi:MAG: DNA polymerase I [Lachnospiraceae bacterium]|nr:DNA polymerase I [Lachnospiraceae bacterium]
MSKIVLIDGHSILNRAFYGVPDLTNAKGLHTNAVYGFLNILFKILEEEKPDYLTVAFDVKAPTFRHEIYKEYKGTRKPMPEELREQVPVMKEVLQAMGVLIMEKAGLEADDILGTIAKRSEKEGIEVSLVSGDRDLLQIASEHIKIRIPKTKGGKTEIEDYYAADVENAYQVNPIQFIDLKALMGDTADNIPGVPKVGEKTATDLMVTYGSLEAIYEHVEEITKKSIRESLIANKELADLSKVLATINVDADIDFSYEKAKLENLFTDEAYEKFKQLEFKNMLNRFEVKEKKTEFSYEIIEIRTAEDAKQIFADCKAAKRGAVRLICAEAKDEGSVGENANGQMFLQLEEKREVFACLLCFDEKKVYCLEAQNGLSKDVILDGLHELTAAEEMMLACFDGKQDYRYLAEDLSGEKTAEALTNALFDCKIAAYLMNPLKNDYEIVDIANEYLGVTIQSWSEVFGKTDLTTAFQDKRTECIRYYAQEVITLYQTAPVLQETLGQSGMDVLFRELEMPLSYVLYDMEKEGILVKKEELRLYGEALTGRITELENSIHEAAGEDFNINSPKQLGEVLFEKLQLPGGKKTKTGYSTAADVLEKLAPEYPIVSEILEYRGLAKLKSTYADGLAAYIEDDNRIHTNFNQTITATGRLSSTEPNLQNIPMKMELGRRIRKVFVPAEGCVFTDADYSQIELRVLAHMSGDAQLIEAYQLDEDIHRITASKVFNTPLEEVTDLQRRNAKAVNFGIVYGISSFGLSQDLSISPKEAKVYIDEYFKTYPGIKTFLDKTVANAKENGYCESLFGRRRPVPELKSSNFMQRSFGERIAMNSPIQGTAADIIKMAMLHVFNTLRTNGLKSKLILQIHDELLIETRESEVEQVKTILVEEMQNATLRAGSMSCEMAVRMEVDLHTGENWYEAK